SPAPCTLMPEGSMRKTQPRSTNLEMLEPRQLLSSSGQAVLASNGTLTITGTNGDDTILLENGGPAVILNGKEFAFPDSSATRVVVNCLKGDDNVLVGENFADDNPLTMNLDAGNNSVLLQDAQAGITAGNGNNAVTIAGNIALDYFRAGNGVNTLDLTPAIQPQTFDLTQYPSVSRLIN